MSETPGAAFPVIGAGYTILRELGGGGMSRVFVAREHALDRDVVVKVLSRDLAESLSAARFGREIRLAAALQEPRIVPVHSAGETADGLPYYVMPYVRGESLRAHMARGAMPVPQAVGILRDVARALAHAHEQGIVHRDIKPENVLISAGTAVVTDFGIAKAIRAARDAGRDDDPGTLTSLGMSLGTPAYMAPEQAAGDLHVDHRADLYAWGVMAWELLAGRHPFADRTTAQRLVAAHIAELPPPLTGVPRPLADLVMRCLEKDPASRPASATVLLAGLDAAASGAIPVASAPNRRTAVRWYAAIAGTAIVLAAAGLAFALLGREGAPEEGTTGKGARAVGVVAFQPLGGDGEDAYLSEGMAQEIADALARVPGLRVAFHNPAMRGGGSAPRDPRELGRRLNVDVILQGTVQRAGSRVRVSARLVNVADGFQLWSQKFDRELADVFALQDEVARGIAAGLQPTLAPEVRDTLVRVTTRDPEAHTLWMQGMYFWNRRGSDNLYRSITYFERALQRDPRFARAWAGIALAYSILVTWDDVDVPATLAKALAAADSALAIDSTTSEAWTAIGQARTSLWQNAEAAAAYERAIALDPNSAVAHQWYGEHLARLGRFDEGLAHVAMGQRIAPLSAVVNVQEGRLALQSRQYDRARRALGYVLQLDSNYTTAHTLLGGVQLAEGEHETAIASLERSLVYAGGSRSLNMAFLAHALATAGQVDSARALLASIERLRRAGKPISYGGLALVLHVLGDTSRALAMLDTGVRRYDGLLQMHARDPAFDALRRVPAAAAVFARMEAGR